MDRTNRKGIENYQRLHGDFWKRDADRLVDMFSECYVVDGVARWKSNDSVPPTDILYLWNHVGKSFDLDKSLKVKEKEDAEFLEEYRRQQAHKELSEETLLEMKSAFGENTKVVDIITGKEYQL